MMRRASVFAAFFFLIASASAWAADESFSWRQAAGQSLRIMLNKHPYAEGIIRRIREFEELTGIKVAYIMHPEARYFQILEQGFSDPSASSDVYMTGLYQVWGYAPQNRMLPLDQFIANPGKTRQSYNINDFFPGILGAFRWNGKAGSRLGEGPLWAIPLGFEANALTYNREALARHRLPVPASMEELIETGIALNRFEGEGTYGIAARGVAEWSSLHSGYITTYTNYGATDFAVEDGRLVSQVNSPEAVAVTDLWVRMLRECGPDDWENSDWYRCLDDLGDRRAAILFDSDILGYYADSPGSSSQSGKLAMAPPPIPPGADPASVKSNLWVWGLAINPESQNRDAAWLFVQYFTSKEFQLWSVLDWKSVNPPRRSVFEAPAFQSVIAATHGYLETFNSIIENTEVQFTPTPYFFDISDRWAAVIRDITTGKYRNTEEGMTALKVWMDNKVAKIPVE